MRTLFLLPILGFSIMANAQTKIIAHRGFSGIAPENTLASFQKAIEAKADYFELDVHTTKDDSLVVIHDATVNRTSSNGMKGNVADMTYRELMEVHMGFSSKFGTTYASEKIPTLREALELAKGKIKVCIELKVHDAEKQVLQLISELGMHDQVIIFSFYYDVLTNIRKVDKDIPILLLNTLANSKTIEKAKTLNATAVGIGTNPSKGFIDSTHSAGIEVWQWTVNDEAKMWKLIDMGIDGLITNYPNLALNKVK
ncbi:MAG: hypothetical protein KDC79_12495 [Cyclobacteriaceae bacterium]|nr:hypothetical protein [Cyclobacteriaceae bacterium]